MTPSRNLEVQRCPAAEVTHLRTLGSTKYPPENAHVNVLRSLSRPCVVPRVLPRNLVRDIRGQGQIVVQGVPVGRLLGAGLHSHHVTTELHHDGLPDFHALVPIRDAGVDKSGQVRVPLVLRLQR
jgi:hypothetical protein